MLLSTHLRLTTRLRPNTRPLLSALLFLLSLLLTTRLGQAQDVSTYQFAASSGTFVPIVGGTVITQMAQDDYITSSALSIGFDFYYGGTLYTQVQATSEGYLDLNGTTRYASTSNGFGNRNRFIAPLWDDLSGTGGTASYSSTGTPGSRVFTFQWLNWRWNNNASVANISFQVKLYEGSNVIQFIYRPENGPFFSTTVSASIGLDGGTYYAGNAGNINNYLGLSDASANPIASNLTSTSVNTINTRPAAGQTYTFTPINDYCGHATLLTIGSSVTGSTLDATILGDPTATCSAGGTGTPSQSSGVFYKFVGNGQTATVSTCSGPTATGGNTKIFVYSGTCGNFVCVGNNDNVLTGGCGTNTQASAVTLPTITGTVYYVFVQFSQTNTVGPFGLSLTGTGLATKSALGAGSVEVFPNPARQAFTLRLPALTGERRAHITLINSLGQQVHLRSLELNAGGAQAEIDVRGLAAGLYTLRVQVGKHTAAQQVVVE